MARVVRFEESSSRRRMHVTTINPIQVQEYLSGINYPASKEDIVKRAQDHGADKNALDALQRMPGDRFNSPNDVSEAIGKLNRD